MSEDLIKHLQADNDRLRTELANTSAEAKKYRLSKKSTVEEMNKLKSDYDAASQELEKLRKSPSALGQEVEKLRGELRQRDHKAAFGRIAKELKVKDDAVEDLYTLSGYKADTDAVDEEAVKTLIAANVEKRPYLLASEGSQNGQQKATLTPGPAMGRGKPAEGLGGFRMSAEDAASPAFMQRYQAQIAQAGRDGNLVFDN
jgi:DNA repair exonuclease SbcCD ATPase subunit